MAIHTGNRLSALIAMAIVTAVAVSAFGGAYTWTYTAGDANWTDPNWSVAGWPGLPGDTATIGGALSASRTIYMTEPNVYLKQLTFSSTDPNWGYVLSNPVGGPGAAITFDDGTSRLTYARLATTNAGGSVNMYQINVPIILNDNLLFYATTNNTAKVQITGSIFDGSGSRGLTMASSVVGDYLYLDGNNSYSGGTRVVQGNLYARAANALGYGPVTVYGGLLNITDGNAPNHVTSITNNRGTIYLTSASVASAPAIVMNGGTLRIQAEGTFDFQADVVINYASTFEETNLSGPPASSAPKSIRNFTVNSSTVSMTDTSGNLQQNSPQWVTGITTLNGIANIITSTTGHGVSLRGLVTGNGGLWKSGALNSSVSLTSANNDYSGGTYPASASIYGYADNTFGTGPIYLRNGNAGIVIVNGTDSNFSMTFNNLLNVQGVGVVNANRPTNTQAALSHAMGSLQMEGASRLLWTNTNYATTGRFLGETNLNGATFFDISGTVRLLGVVSGAGTVAVRGGGSLTLEANSNAFSGTISPAAGAIYLRAPFASGGNPVVIPESGVVEANMLALSGSTVTVYSAIADTTNGRLRGVEADAFSGASITLKGGIVRMLNDSTVSMGGNLTVDSPVFFSGLEADRSSAGSGQVLSIGSLTMNTDQYLTINGQNSYRAAVDGLTTLVGGSAYINTIANGLILNGAVTGAGKLMKTGAGMLVVGGGAQSWNGGMQINAGAVRLVTPDANLGGGDTVLSGSATLATLGLWNDGAPGTETSVGLGRIVVASGGQNYLDSNSTTANITYVLPNDLVLQSGSLLHINNVKTNSIRVAGTTSVSGRAQIDSNGVGAVTLGPIAGDSGSYLLLTGRGATYSVNLVSAVDANFVGSLGVGGVAYNAAGIAAGGTVSLRKEGTLQSIAGLDVYKGGTFLVDDSVDGNIAAWNVANRLNDNLQVTMRGGEFRLAAPDGNLASETVGTLKLASGVSTISSIRVAAANNANTSAMLTLGSISRDTGAMALFTSNTNNVLGSTMDKINVTAAPALTGGVIGGWAITTANNWVSYDSNVGSLANMSTYKTTQENTWAAAGDNVSLSASTGLTDNRTINTLRIGGTITIDANNYLLKVSTGGIMAMTGNFAPVIMASGTGGLTVDTASGNTELFFNLQTANTSRVLLVSAPIVNDSGNAVSVVSSMQGTLQLTSPTNNFSGGLYVNNGTVEANYLTSTNGTVTLAGGKLTVRKDTSDTLAGLVLKDNYSTMDVRALSAGTNQTVTFTSLEANDLTGLTVTGANGHDVNISGTTTLRGATVFSVNSTNTDLILAGGISGVGSFEKIGVTNLILGGSGSGWSGGFTLTEGNMIVTASNGLGTGAGLVRGGRLEVRATNAVPADADLTVNSGGTASFYSIQSQNTGELRLAGGTLNLRANSGTSWGLNAATADNTGDITATSIINVNKVSGGTEANDVMHTLSSLTMGTQQLTITGANGHDVAVSGTTSLIGSAVISINTANTDLWLNGPIKGTGSLTRVTAGGYLYLNSTDTSSWTGGLSLLGGTTRVNAEDSNAMGAGDVTLGATLALRTDRTGEAVINLPNLKIADNSSIYISRLTSLPDGNVAFSYDSNATLRFNNLTIGYGHQLSVYGAARTGSPASDKNYTLEFGGTTTLLGPAVFQVDSNIRALVFSGKITGIGGLYIGGTGNPSGNIILSGTGNDFTSGVNFFGDGALYGATPGCFGYGPVFIGDVAYGAAGFVEANVDAFLHNSYVMVNSGILRVREDAIPASCLMWDSGTVSIYTPQAREPNVVLQGGTLVLYGPTGTDLNINVSVQDVDGTIYGARGPSDATAATQTIHNLTMGENRVLTTSNTLTNGYGVTVDGATTLTKGDALLTPGSGTTIFLAGMVTGSGRLVAVVSGAMYIDGNDNNYTGGTKVDFGTLGVRNWRALGSGPVLVMPRAALSLDGNGAAYNNAITLEREAGFSTSRQWSMLGATSLMLNGTTLSLNLPQNYSGGVILNTDSSLTVTNLNDSNLMPGSALGTGQVTMTSSTLTLLSNVDYVWGNDVSIDGASIINVNKVSGSGTTNNNRLHTLGALVASNTTLSPANIVTANGHRVAFSGLDLTGGLTISGLDLSFNRDPAKRVSILGATNLTVSADANLYIGGTADMLTDTVVDANFHLSIVNNNQVFVTGTAIHNAGNVSGPGLAASGRTNIAAGATLGVTRIRQQQVDVSGKLVLNGGAGPATSIVNALNIAGVTDAWTGLVDIRQGYLVLPSATASDVGNQVKQASNFAAFGSWDGTGGITSSSAAGDQLYGVGYADNAIAKKSEFGEANGLAYTGVLVRYTYVGDTNLDGITDLDKDYYNWSFGYLNAGNNTWYYGDFNYDGQVDLDKDYYIWSYGYLNQGSPLVGGAESAVDTSPSSAPVPEPTTVGLLGLGLLGLLRRRSRKA